MKIIRIIGLVLAALAVLYSILVVSRPEVLKTAEVASEHSREGCIFGLIFGIFFISFVQYLYKKFDKNKEAKVMVTSLTIFLAALSFFFFALIITSFNHDHHYNGKRWERAGFLDLNYPGKGGKYDNLSLHTIRLKDGTTITLFPIREREVKLLNLIGEDGSKGLPAFIEKQTNDDNFEKFRASFNQAGLGKYFHGQATITIEF